MRIFIIISLLLGGATGHAQVFLPGSFLNNSYRGSFSNNIHLTDSAYNKKWSFSKYGSISTGISFFKGGNATFISASVGVQLNRRLNNNLFAFAGVSAAPSYVSFRSLFMSAGLNKLNPNTSFNSSALGIYSRAELGLQYINDARTFSISGSIGVEKSSFPVPAYIPANINRSATNASFRR